MKRRKRAKNTENTWTLISNGKIKVVPFIEHRWKTNLKWSHRGSIEKGKAREILYREGCAQSFSRFLILDQRWRARGRSAPRTRMVGLDPRCMLSLLLPNSILELQVFPRYSPSSSYAYGWNFGNETFLLISNCTRKVRPQEPWTLMSLDGITNARVTTWHEPMHSWIPWGEALVTS